MQPRRARERHHDDVTITTQIDAELIPILWEMYAEAFEPLRELALLNHVYARDLFEELLADPRVYKVIGWRNDEPIGLAPVTSWLELVPQISPPYLRRRYPEHAARHAIYFAVFVCVSPRMRSNTMFSRLIAGIAQIAAVDDGIVVFDISKSNCDAELHTNIERITDWFPRRKFAEIDSQHYFAIEFPEPLERLPFSKRRMPRPVIDLREAREAAEKADQPTSKSDDTTTRQP